MSVAPDMAARVATPRHPLDLTPAEFARHVLGMELYGWQDRMLTELDAPGAYSIRTCNEAGKTTSITAPWMSWFLTTFPLGQLVCTAGVFRQTKTQLWPKLRNLARDFEGWTVLDATLENGRGGGAIGFRAIDPNLFEGYHGSATAPLGIVVDEGKAVADDIFTGIARCRPQWLLVLSTPGEASGEFYRSQTTHRRFYKTFPPVTAYDCPHIDRKAIAREIEKWGINHPLIRSMIFAEFTRAEEAGAIITLSDAERAVHRPPAFVDDAAVSAFCDFAKGGDENCLAVRRGNRVRVVAAWRDADTMRARDAFIQYFERQNLRPEQISGDNGGLGGAVIDALSEHGWPINRFNGGASAFDSSRFADRNAEMWNEFGADLRQGRWIVEDAVEPDGDTLVSQLSGRKGRRDGKGRLALERKEDMKQSPDRADAVIGACCEVAGNFSVTLI